MSGSSSSSLSKDPRAAKRTVIPKRRQEVLKWNGWGYKGNPATKTPLIHSEPLISHLKPSRLEIYLQ